MLKSQLKSGKRSQTPPPISTSSEALSDYEDDVEFKTESAKSTPIIDTVKNIPLVRDIYSEYDSESEIRNEYDEDMEGKVSASHTKLRNMMIKGTKSALRKSSRGVVFEEDISNDSGIKDDSIDMYNDEIKEKTKERGKERGKERERRREEEQEKHGEKGKKKESGKEKIYKSQHPKMPNIRTNIASIGVVREFNPRLNAFSNTGTVTVHERSTLQHDMTDLPIEPKALDYVSMLLFRYPWLSSIIKLGYVPTIHDDYALWLINRKSRSPDVYISMLYENFGSKCLQQLIEPDVRMIELMRSLSMSSDEA